MGPGRRRRRVWWHHSSRRLTGQAPHVHERHPSLLEAGATEFGEKSDTLSGTPQGGIISPLLASMAFDGLQRSFGAGNARGKHVPSAK